MPRLRARFLRPDLDERLRANPADLNAIVELAQTRNLLDAIDKACLAGGHSDYDVACPSCTRALRAIAQTLDP